jgi:hypothetical protein
MVRAPWPPFHIGDARRLRIDVQVPQAFAGSMQPGVRGDMQFAYQPGRSWPARVVRTADAYAEIDFERSGAHAAPRIPASALIFRGSGLFAATVSADNRAKLEPIQPGRDFGTELEVLSGIVPGERVIINPPDSLVDNQLVRVAGARQASGAPTP